MDEWRRAMYQAMGFACIGVAIGIGQLLASQERLTRRIIIGRALSTGGIAMGAGFALIWFPSLPPVAMIGLAALLASLGTSALEKMFQRFIGKGA